MTITNILFVAGGTIIWNVVKAPVYGTWWKFTGNSDLVRDKSAKQVFEWMMGSWSALEKLLNFYIYPILLSQFIYWFYS
jgi:hypothetical protein